MKTFAIITFTHASICLDVLLQHGLQTASSDPLSGLGSVSTQYKTCSENVEEKNIKTSFKKVSLLLQIIPTKYINTGTIH